MIIKLFLQQRRTHLHNHQEPKLGNDRIELNSSIRSFASMFCTEKQKFEELRLPSSTA